MTSSLRNSEMRADPGSIYFEFQPVRGNIQTRVKKLLEGNGDALIVASGEAAVVGVTDQPHLRELGRNHRRAAIGGRIVDDDDFD